MFKISLVSGVAFLTSLFIEIWLATIGLAIALYDYQLNKSTSSFLSLGIGVIFGLIPAIAGFGLLRRRRWSRWVLMVFWLGVSLFIIILNLMNLEDSAYGSEWWGEVIPWLCIAVVGFLQVMLLKSRKVKELFYT